MKKNSDLVKHYAVQIKSDFGKTGSGVLIKIDDKKCYLATAKHNLTTKNMDNSGKDVKQDFLEKQLSNISVLQNKEEICKVVKITCFCDGHDVIIFEVEDINNEFKKLSKVNILYAEDYGKGHEYFFHGYPQDKKDNDDIVQDLYIKNNTKYTYTLGSNEPARKNALEGFSGSGVFIVESERLYLVGILIQRFDGLSSYESFNLPMYLNEQEPSLLPLTKDILDLENFDDMKDLIIRRNYNNPLVQEYKNVFKGDTAQASKLPDKAKEVGYLGKKFQVSNQFIETEANFRKELADMYLLATIISKQFDEDTLVKYYFKKATEYEPRYIRYLKDIEIEYSIDELMRDAKIALVDDRFNDAKILFEALLPLNINENQRIYSYEKILEIAKIHYHDKEIIETSKKLLELYSEEEKLKKAIIYYNLSMMDEDAFESVMQGLSIIKDESINPNFFEIQYKLKRRKNELLGVEEEILMSKDSHLGLRINLKSLSFVDKNYKSEYEQIVLKEKYKDLIKKKSTKIWVRVVLILLFSLILSFLLFILLDIAKSTVKIGRKNNIEAYNVKNKNSKEFIYEINATSKAIFLKGFSSAKSDVSQQMEGVLKDILYSKISNLDRVSTVQVYGHTDLEYQENNNLLGRQRAVKVQKVIAMVINESKIEVQYNPDFFMRDTDKILQKTLLKELGLNDEVVQLVKELNISREASIEETRNSFQDIDLAKYSERLAPFRSVVIVINF